MIQNTAIQSLNPFNQAAKEKTTLKFPLPLGEGQGEGIFVGADLGDCPHPVQLESILLHQVRTSRMN